jgi:hypothetical protein
MSLFGVVSVGFIHAPDKINDAFVDHMVHARHYSLRFLSVSAGSATPPASTQESTCSFLNF